MRIVDAEDPLVQAANAGQLGTLTTHLSSVTEKLDRGAGTLGKLINDDSFLKNAKLSLQKLDKATDGLEDQGPLSVLGLAIGSLF